MSKGTDPVKLVFFLLAVAVVILMFSATWADGDCKGHSCNDTTPNISIDNASPVSNSVSHSSRAIGVSGGDVDIAQSYRSYSILFGLWQDTKVNPLELARQLVAEGYYQEAAELRCAPHTVSKALGGKDKCIAKFSQPPQQVVFEVPVIIEELDADEVEYEEEWHEEQMQMQQDYDERLEMLESRLNRPAPRPQVIEKTVQQPFLSDEKRAKLQAVLDE